MCACSLSDHAYVLQMPPSTWPSKKPRDRWQISTTNRSPIDQASSCACQTSSSQPLHSAHFDVGLSVSLSPCGEGCLYRCLSGEFNGYDGLPNIVSADRTELLFQTTCFRHRSFFLSSFQVSPLKCPAPSPAEIFSQQSHPPWFRKDTLDWKS